MSIAIGIDLGTWGASIAISESGRITVVPNREGARRTPSTVTWTVSETIVGGPARRAAPTATATTGTSLLRLLARRHEEVRSEARWSRLPLAGRPGEPASLEVQGRRRDPADLVTELLRSLLADARRELGHDTPPATGAPAVVAVPVWFDPTQREAVRRAARAAGLDVSLVTAPTAAVAAAEPEPVGHRSRLVVDVGAGGVDVSVVEAGAGVVEVRATAGVPIGTLDVDRHLAEQALAGAPPSVRDDPVVRAGLATLTEQARTELCRADGPESTALDAPLPDGRRLQMTVTRSDVEAAAEDLVGACARLVDETLRAARTTPGELDDVLLLGGATRMPQVRAAIEAAIGRPTATRDDDELVAAGAALLGTRRETDAGPVVFDTLGQQVVGHATTGEDAVLVPRGSAIPSRGTRRFHDVGPGWALDLVVRHDAGPMEDRVLGRLAVQAGTPAPGRLDLTVDVDADGVLRVIGTDPSTGSDVPLRYVRGPGPATTGGDPT